MLTTISIILVLLGLIVIALIILKKFPSLAILDVENIPGQKEAKFKEQIIKSRLERDLAKWGGLFIKLWQVLNKAASGPLHNLYNRLKNLKEFYQKNKKLTLSQRREHIRNLFRIAEDSLKADDLDKAENSLIEIISLEQKNLPAFVELAEVYAAGKKWAEAKQTLGYALKLAKLKDEHFIGDITIQQIYFSLGWVCQELGDYHVGLDNICEALELEPNNPRFLDLAIELAILDNNKKLAQELFDRLREVNPENAKLDDFREEIFALVTSEVAQEETIE